MGRKLMRVFVAGCFLMSFWSACGKGTPVSEKPVVNEKTADAGPADKKVADAGPADRTELTAPEKAEVTAPDKVVTPDKGVVERPTEKLVEGPGEKVAEAINPDQTFAGLTYWKDIKAILEKNCATCHVAKGIGPFPLTEYKFANTYKASIKAEVQAGRMPPWQADKTCGDYTNDISLPPVEKAKLIQWVDQGGVEGDPKDYKAPPPGGVVGLKKVDLTLKMKKSYQIKAKPDDYRCFVLDWPHKTPKYVTGFQVKAGNASIVHHVIAYIAKKGEADQYLKKDPNGDGYTCYGTAGGPAGLRWLGTWAPGVPGAEYYPGTGIRVDPDSKIIVQLHYNVQPNVDASDQTSVDFTLEDSVKKAAILFPYTNPKWLSGKTMKIAAGDANATHNFNFSLSFLGLLSPKVKGLTIYSAMLHMHQLGKSGTLHMDNNQCLLNIPRWDFNWQLIHHLKKPVSLGLSGSVGITCHWDNSAANQPVVNGTKQTPKDVYWGDGTSDEMCLGIVYMTCEDSTKASIDCPDLSSFMKAP